MKANRRLLGAILGIGLVLVLTPRVYLRAQPQPASSPAALSPLNQVIAIQGRVEILKAGATNWMAAARDQVLQSGDRIRTGEASSVTVRLTTGTQTRVDQLSVLTIAGPAQEAKRPWIEILRGALYFFHRDKPGAVGVRTRLVSAGALGTEYAVRVHDDGRTVISVLDGTVEMATDQGTLPLASGDEGTASEGRPPSRTAVIDAIRTIQWCLYYPGVLDLTDLKLANLEPGDPLTASIEAYRAGDVKAAFAAYPDSRAPATDAERLLRAGLLLAVGRVEEAEAQLNSITPSTQDTRRLADALRLVIATVQNRPVQAGRSPSTPTEWLAESYALQAAFRLEPALEAAREATRLSPENGFAWTRVGELEFGMGRAQAASEAVSHALRLSPRNAQAVAVQGFLLAAQNRIGLALDQFEAAINLDPMLAHGWLGRGLCRIRQGKLHDGTLDLQTAAAMEPQRALLRSYLAKALTDHRDFALAGKELDLAIKLDRQDPTPWLYSALLKQQQNRINEAILDLETSKGLNDNRGLFRSRFLLDQDRAVRSANLASIYQEAGMDDIAYSEAGRAVTLDYANYSAHLFLANAYDQLRDPKQVNLRYETPWFSEYLVANLLAPPGAGVLSSTISQQEYSGLFEREKLGLRSSTEYFSSGSWIQHGSQFGSFGGTSYELGANLRFDPGQRPNNETEFLTFHAQVKQQITPSDTLYLQGIYYDAEAGDARQYYDQTSADTTFSIEENQEPLLFLGYHHEWAPGSRTLLLLGGGHDQVRVDDPARGIAVPIVGALPTFPFDQIGFDFQGSALTELYSAELQHIFQTHRSTLVVGLRGQFGEQEFSRQLSNPSSLSFLFGSPAFSDSSESDFRRWSAYAYETFEVMSALSLVAGLAYEDLTYHLATTDALAELEERRVQKVLPKAGLVWTPHTNTTVRAAFSQSLTGQSIDQSFRIEPSQMAGINQVYRSTISDSLVGPGAGDEGQVLSLVLDHRLFPRTYLQVRADLLQTDMDRSIGTFNVFLGAMRSQPGSVDEQSDYEEKSMQVAIHQLLGNHVTLGARYRLNRADLKRVILDPRGTMMSDTAADLHQFDAYALANLPCGFFARCDAQWAQQSNRGYRPDQPGDDFWQLHLYAGYRFAARRAEVRIGCLNLTDQDYQLNPLNYYLEYPRERTLTARLLISF